MDDSLFQSAMAFVWRPENDGQGYHVTPGDAGGATSWGVTWATWNAWRVAHQPGSPGGQLIDFARLPKEAFLPLYRTMFWNAIGGDWLPPGLGLQMFDLAVTSGTHRAVLLLQYSLAAEHPDLAIDGAMGPMTMAAARIGGNRLAALLAEYHDRRAMFYRDLNKPRFIDGWLRRAADAAAAAEALLACDHPVASRSDEAAV